MNNRQYFIDSQNLHLNDLDDEKLIEEVKHFAPELVKQIQQSILMNFPTSTVNVLPHLVELRKTWKDQDFRFTKEQQEEYDILLQARKERVKFFL